MIDRKRIAAASALVVVAAGGTAVVLATGSSGDGSKARAASTSTATATVKRQDLVETETEDGTLGFSDTRSVINRLSGTVTWLPSQGDVIEPDHALYKVDGKPVILMSGQVPVYRALKAGISDGADIEQLEKTLRATGYDPSGALVINDSWGPSTTAAVKRWQDAHGFTETGQIGLGQIVFLPGERRIASMSVTLGGSTSGGGGGNSNVAASDADLASQAGDGGMLAYVSPAEMAQATPPVTTTPTTTTPATTAPATTTPSATTTTPPATTTPSATTPARAPATTTPASTTTPAAATTPRGSSDDEDDGSSDGGGAGVSNTIMTTTSTRRVVTVAMDTTKSSLAKAGARVSVDLPSGDSVDGRVTSVGKVATSSASEDDAGGGGGGGDDATATIKVTIRLSKIRTSLDQAPVAVNFEQSRRRDVLAIPVTALLARPGGTFAVEAVGADGAHKVIPVQTGLYTSGFVEIEGAGLREGMRVTNAAV